MASDTHFLTQFPLSSLQQGFLFHSLYDQQNNLYCNQVQMTLQEKIKPAQLERAFNELIARHDVMRANFNLEENNLEIHPKVTIKITLHDLTNKNDTDQKRHTENFLISDKKVGFNLKKPPLIRANLFKISSQEFLFVMSYHHALFGGPSALMLVTELFKIYDAAVTQQAINLPKSANYEHYINYLKNYDPKEAEEYWRKQLSKFTEIAALPNFHQSTNKKVSAKEVCFKFSNQLTQQLKKFAHAQHITPNIVCQTVWSLLLARYTGTQDIVFGVVRELPRNKLKNLAGLFINTLPLRLHITGKTSGYECLQKMREQNQQLPNFINTPLSEIQQWCKLPPGTALFATVFDFKPQSPNAMIKGLWPQRSLHFSNDTNYPLFIEVFGEDTALQGRISSNGQYEKKFLNQISQHFQNLVNNLISSPEKPVVKLPYLSRAEEKKILIDWNKTEAVFPRDKTLHQLFEEQVVKTPDKIAVIYDDQKLSYRALNQKANQLAHYLKKQNIQPETIVAICIERSLEMIIGILGILKAGGAYLPIDPDYPHARIQYMLEDSASPILLTQNRLKTALSTGLKKIKRLPKIICLDSNWTAIAKEKTENPINLAKPDNLVYVIYTSGTTGKPKGVCNTHQGLVNRISWMQSKYTLQNKDRVLQKTPLTFDVSVWEIFLPINYGAELVIAKPEAHINPDTLIKTIKNQKISVIHFVPSMLAQFLGNANVSHCKTLRMIFSSGEVLSQSLQKHYLTKLHIPLINLYGPTEASIDVTYYECNKILQHGGSLIGKPIANTKIYILDELLQPVGIGISNELYIEGAGVARGYLNQPKLTKEKFIQNPFGPGKLYKTGDIGRWLFDGNIEFIHRIDDQVKLRGFRIELREIISTLENYPAVKQALVIQKEIAPNDKRLIAYLIPQKNSLKLNPADLKEYLKQFLPEYMIPYSYIQISQFKLTSNGKIDKNALPEPDIGSINSCVSHTPPRNPEEQILTNLWSDVLKLKPQNISVHDNFFELGGHSLLAMQLAVKIRASFSIELNIHHLFERPTIAELSDYIRQNYQLGAPILTPPAPIDRKKHLPLSFSQKRLWFLAQLEPDNSFYNMFIALQLRGDLNIPALEWALLKIIQRHEILRTRFVVKDGEPYQDILSIKDLQYKLEMEDVSNLTNHNLEILIRDEGQTVFELSQKPPMRTRLLRLAPDNYRLLINIHHILGDGWSFEIMTQELSRYYQSYDNEQFLLKQQIAQLPIQYADFSAWQTDLAFQQMLEPQLKYWKQQLQNISTLNLPTDYTRPAQQTYQGKRLSFKVSNQTSEKLIRLAQENHTTIFTVLLSAFNILLARYCNQEDIVVGTPIAGRHYPLIENLVGLFVNTLVLRTNLANNPSFLELLQQNKQITLKAFANQDVPFEKLVETLQPTRDLSRNPLCQVMLVLQNSTPQLPKLPHIKISRVSADNKTLLLADYESAKFDLTFYLQESSECINGLIEYNSDLFEASTIKRITKHFEVLLTGIAENPHQSIYKLPLLTPKELKTILIDWNDTDTDYPRDKTVHQLFEEQVKKTPDNIAVIFEDQQLTYRELNQKANQLAHYLRKQGVKPETLVAICIERSLEMIIGILGIIKAGGAYVPIDPSYPPYRVKELSEELKLSIILSNLPHKYHTSISRFFECFEKVITLTTPRYINEDSKDINCNISSSNLFNIMHTSGSSGKPKGVMIEHRSVVSFLSGFNKKFTLKIKKSFLAISSISFDISVLEIFFPLINGLKCIIAPEKALRDDLSLKRIISKHNISAMQATPTTWKMLLHTKWPIKSSFLLFCGGEALTTSLAEKLLLTGARVWNLYGPTETTIWATIYHLKSIKNSGSIVQIGKPLPNTKIFILNKYLEPTPINVTGEIYIGGNGLARGYLEHSLFIDKSFVSNSPYNTNLYKTGDLARWLHDGNIEYIGRFDQQVKIRGHRINTFEIERIINAHKDVKESVVVTDLTSNFLNALSAYIVPKIQSNITGKDTYHLQKEQIMYWNKVYDEYYSDNKANKPNTSEWISSYTKKPIKENEMKEWLDQTTERIMSLHPTSVLEIGCGVGLLLFKLISKCQKYKGTDFSKEAINYIQKNLSRNEKKYVILKKQSAISFQKTDFKSYDTVILNSIVQYFPNLEYFMEVLEGAIASTSRNGHIFIGDIRSLPHAEAFHTSVLIFQSKTNSKLEDFTTAARLKAEREIELLVDPDFFYAYAKLNPRISHVEVLLKRGKHYNEMNCYRYDVILYIDQNAIVQKPELSINWFSSELCTKDVEKYLAHYKPNSLRINEIPNARLTDTLKKINPPLENSNVFHNKKIRKHNLIASIDPEELWELSIKYPYKVIITWASINPLSCFDAIFVKKSLNHVWIENQRTTLKSDLSIYTNNPLKRRHEQKMINDVRMFLKDRLPVYMVPESYAIIKSLPILATGKLDKSALPKSYYCENLCTYVPPTNHIEITLSRIWGDIFGIDKIGVKENFFDLGGHSLLAMQVVSKINKELNININIKTIFEAPSIYQLSLLIKDYLNQKGEIENEPYTIKKVSRDTILTLQDKGNKTPLFLIHPAGGTIFCYLKLLKALGNDRKYHAIQDPGFGNKDYMFNSIQEMASHYKFLILEKKVSGPYLLGGSSSGGIIAIEIASQLQLAGHEIENVLLFDSWIRYPKNFNKKALFDKVLKQQFNITKKNLDEKRFKYKNTLINFYTQRLRLIFNYIPNPIDFKVALFKASELSPEYTSIDDPTNYWQNYLINKMNVFKSPGNHETMLTEPNVQVLASLLNKYLNSVEKDFFAQSKLEIFNSASNLVT